MIKMRKNEGITLSTLLIVIIILLILLGSILVLCINQLKKNELEELKTNLLLIQAKAIEYVEEANFKINSDDIC
jgi:type II secretory pathway pseudopilin PulG